MGPISRSAFLLALGTSFFVTACGSAPISPPSVVSSHESAAILGDAPDFAFSVRLDLLRADPVYGAMVGQALQKEHDRDVLHYYYAIDAVDGFAMIEGNKGIDSALVMTARGPTIGDFPQELRKEVNDNDKWQSTSLATGVLELTTALDGHPIGLYLTKTAWVLYANHAADGGHAHFSASASPPPPVEFGDDVLVGVWMGPKAFANPTVQSWSTEPGSRGLQSALFVIHTSAKGDAIYDAHYDTAAHANDAVSFVRDKLGSYGESWADAIKECPALSQLQVEATASGRDVHLRIGGIPAVIQGAMKQCG